MNAMRPSRLRNVLRLVASTLIAASVAGAQEAASPINDLLKSAKDALNDLKFARADTVAREVLARVAQLRRSQALLAWEIAAAARFPEEGAPRDTAEARAAMRQIVKLDLDARFPADIRWAGLEALLDEEKRTTLGMALRVPRSEIIYGGSVGDALVRVATSVPCDVFLSARASDGGTEIVLDSTMGTREAALRVRALRGTVPILATGAYEFVVRVRDNRNGTSMERSMQASVTAPSLEFVAEPAPLDTSKLQLEVSRTSRRKGIVTGVVFGALTIALNQALRASDPVKSTGSDGRANLIAFAVAAGTGAAVWFDHGTKLTSNREANEKLRREAAQRVTDARTENERRTTGYRAKLTLLLEDK